MEQFSLTLNALEHGSVRACASAGEQNSTMFVSYLSDALGDMADSVLALLRAQSLDKVTCSWQDEPGEYRWIFHPVDGRIRIEIRRFENCFSRLPDERGQRLFEADCSLLRLATQVKGQLHRLFNEYGEADYAARWKHPFPTAAFRQLEACIHELKHASTRER